MKTKGLILGLVLLLVVGLLGMARGVWATSECAVGSNAAFSRGITQFFGTVYGIEFDGTPTADRTLTLQDATGTVALLTDIGTGTELAYKAADETVNNSTTLQNDDDLVVALDANSYYAVSAFLRHNTSATADYWYSFTVPSGATGWRFFCENNDTVCRSEDMTVTLNGVGASADEAGMMTGTIFTGGSAGNLQLQWAQKTAEVSDTKILQGSWLKAEKLN